MIVPTSCVFSKVATRAPWLSAESGPSVQCAEQRSMEKCLATIADGEATWLPRNDDQKHASRWMGWKFGGFDGVGRMGGLKEECVCKLFFVGR